MFSINTNVLALFVTSNFVWFFFTAYLILNQVKREKKAQRMISRLSESNEYLSEQLKEVRDIYIDAEKAYQRLQATIHSITINHDEELKDETH